MRFSFLVVSLGLACLALPAPAFAGSNAWDKATPAIKAKAAMRQVLAETRAAKKRGEKPIGLFDLDDTVLNGKPRLYVAAQRAGLPSRGITSAADLYEGLSGSALAAKRSEFGKSYFDDPSLLALDRPQKGALRFLRAFKQAGGRPLYATGRWEETRKETEAELRRLRVPHFASRDLLLNPGPQMKAVEWKKKVPKIARARGRVMGTWDNEATASANYRKAFPGARSFRLNTMRFGVAPAKKPADVIVLRNFAP